MDELINKTSLPLLDFDSYEPLGLEEYQRSLNNNTAPKTENVETDD